MESFWKGQATSISHHQALCHRNSVIGKNDWERCGVCVSIFFLPDLTHRVETLPHVWQAKNIADPITFSLVHLWGRGSTPEEANQEDQQLLTLLIEQVCYSEKRRTLFCLLLWSSDLKLVPSHNNISKGVYFIWKEVWENSILRTF